MKQKLYISGTILLAVSSLVSRILGLARDHTFASYFGAGGTGIYSIDTYYAALRIPDFIFQLLVMGTIGAAFVPIFAEYIHHNEPKKAEQFLNACLTYITGAIIIICVILAIFMPWITPLIVPGFTPQQQELTAAVTRIMLISPMLFSISSIFQSAANAYHRYYSMALAPIIYNASIIIATVVAGKEYGIYAIAWGVVIGALCHTVIQSTSVWHHIRAFRIITDWRNADMYAFIKLALPRIIGIGILQLNLFVDTLIASTLTVGSIGHFNFALNIQSLPLGLIGVSVSIVAFGIFSEHVIKQEHEKLKTALQHAHETITIYIIPATVGLIMLRYNIIGLLFESGRFGEQDTMITGSVLAILAVGLWTQNTVLVLARYYFANKDSKTPVYASITGFILNVIIGVTATQLLHWGILGVATATTIASIAQWYILHYNLKTEFIDAPHMSKYKKIITATVVMGVILGGLDWLAQHAPSFRYEHLAMVAIGVPLGFFSYYIALRLLNYPYLNKWFSPRGLTR